MTISRPRIVVTEPLAPEADEWLADRAETLHVSSDDPEFDAHLSLADGLIVRTYTVVDPGLLERAPKLRVIARAGVGVDNIDLAACREREITVVYTPDANTGPVVEFVVAHILDRFRPRKAVESALDLAAWQETRDYQRAEREISEVTLGIYGLGRIGKRVAKASQGLNIPAIFYDLLSMPPADRFSARPVVREDLLRDSDVITLHVDARAENRHLLDADAFSRMKPDVLVINTARGMLIDARAAAAFFEENPDANAVIDVHEPEPFPADYPLLRLPNVKLTPHIAGRSRLGLKRMSEVVHDVMAVLEGKTPKYPAC